MQTDFIRARAKAALRSTALMTTILKARMYAPGLGRFLQTDPVGYGDGLNWYGYVGGDPVNSIDPTGLETAAQYCGRIAKPENDPICDILVKANKPNATVGNQAGSSGAGSSIGPAALAPDDLVITGRRLVPQRTQTPSPCQAAFLKSQLASRGLPTSQIDSLRFVSGLNAGANAITRQAFGSGATAVTQGSTVYVQPGRFNEVANFRSAIPFEEAYHTSQFASDSGFYSTYGLLSLGGLLSIGDSYKGNLYETFAQGASQQMFEASKTGMCPRGG